MSLSTALARESKTCFPSSQTKEGSLRVTPILWHRKGREKRRRERRREERRNGGRREMRNGGR
jgi:hypothetical protein